MSTLASKLRSVHILVPDAVSLEELSRSRLASTRLRLSVAARKLTEERGVNVTVGPIPPPKSDVILVGKIGANDIDKRSVKWLSAIDGAKKALTKIVLDYTDDHLAYASTMQPFYRNALQLADIVAVPSRQMKINLEAHGKINSHVIPDALEYPICRPRVTEPRRAIWFGHGTNIKYLLDYLLNNKPAFLKDELFVCTDSTSLDLFAKQIKNVPTVRIIGVPWTVENLKTAILNSEFAFLPVGIDDPRKRGAGPNRLLTSLCLGLPVITQGLDSYRDFKRYYTDLQEETSDDFFYDFSSKRLRVLEAQEGIVSNFSMDNVGRKWRSLVMNMMNDIKTE